MNYNRSFRNDQMLRRGQSRRVTNNGSFEPAPGMAMKPLIGVQYFSKKLDLKVFRDIMSFVSLKTKLCR